MRGTVSQPCRRRALRPRFEALGLEKLNSCLQYLKVVPLDENQALLEAYRELNETMRSRGSTALTIYSILLPGSLILATLSLEPGVREEARRVLPVLGAAAIPFGALLAGFLGLLYWMTVLRGEEDLWKQIHQLEHRLGILEGHAKMRQIVQRRLWYKARRFIWPVSFLLAESAYLILFIRLLLI